MKSPSLGCANASSLRAIAHYMYCEYRILQYPNYLLNSYFSILYSKRLATGGRQCLSTGHRKQQDFPLWILLLWTSVAQIKSSASISGQCASYKIVSRDVWRTVRTIELTADAISHIVHTSTEDYSGPVVRYLLCRSTQFKTSEIWKLELMFGNFKKRNNLVGVRIIPVLCLFDLRLDTS